MRGYYSRAALISLSTRKALLLYGGAATIQVNKVTGFPRIWGNILMLTSTRAVCTRPPFFVGGLGTRLAFGWSPAVVEGGVLQVLVVYFTGFPRISGNIHMRTAPLTRVPISLTQLRLNKLGLVVGR